MYSMNKRPEGNTANLRNISSEIITECWLKDKKSKTTFSFSEKDGLSFVKQTESPLPMQKWSLSSLEINLKIHLCTVQVDI